MYQYAHFEPGPTMCGSSVALPGASQVLEPLSNGRVQGSTGATKGPTHCVTVT